MTRNLRIVRPSCGIGSRLGPVGAHEFEDGRGRPLDAGARGLDAGHRFLSPTGPVAT